MEIKAMNTSSMPWLFFRIPSQQRKASGPCHVVGKMTGPAIGEQCYFPTLNWPCLRSLLRKAPMKNDSSARCAFLVRLGGSLADCDLRQLNWRFWTFTYMFSQRSILMSSHCAQILLYRPVDFIIFIIRLTHWPGHLAKNNTSDCNLISQKS